MSGQSGQHSWPQKNVLPVIAGHTHGMQLKTFIWLGVAVHVLRSLCSR